MKLNSAIVLLVLMLTAPSVARARDAGSFLIPGVDFHKLEFDVGSWCRYDVLDEAMGIVDSTEVYLGVTGQETTADGLAYWIEMETRPRGGAPPDARLVKLLVLDSIRAFAEGDSLGQYVLKLYNRNGIHPPEEEDPRHFQDFPLVNPTTGSSWQATDDVPIDTAAGAFICTMKHRNVNNDKEIDTGSVVLLKQSSDDFTVWFSEDIPVFRMARCEIIRHRRTETRPRIPGIPPASSKDSRTRAELVAFGFDAKPKMVLPK